eukprot:6365177-Prymnesium_polylepis.2
MCIRDRVDISTGELWTPGTQQALNRTHPSKRERPRCSPRTPHDAGVWAPAPVHAPAHVACPSNASGPGTYHPPKGSAGSVTGTCHSAQSSM